MVEDFEQELSIAGSRREIESALFERWLAYDEAWRFACLSVGFGFCAYLSGETLHGAVIKRQEWPSRDVEISI
jgi:ABC-type arginine/histidine transport system permease subunit